MELEGHKLVPNNWLLSLLLNENGMITLLPGAQIAVT